MLPRGSRFGFGLLVLILSFSPLVLTQFSQQGEKLVGTGRTGPIQGEGMSVALSADGNTAIVGGPYDNNDVGAAWIFTRSSGVWSQQGNKLVGTGGVGSQFQGYSVSLSGDGNTAMVGGYGDNGRVGAAWIFTRSSGVWSQQGNKLVGTLSGGAPQQGFSVSLSGDGNTAMVGGYGDNGSVGAAWIFTRSSGVWSQQGNKLVGTGGVGLANQGISVSLSGDGNTAVVGGYFDNTGVGAAWIFTRSSGVWSQQGDKLVGIGNVGAGPGYGISVSLSGDGSTAMVGGFGDSTQIGAAWVFTRSTDGWSQQGNKLVGTGGVGSQFQGKSVSLSGDGNTAVVGGYEDNSSVGAAWIFTRSSGVWSQQGIKLVGTGAKPWNAAQGTAVALSADGNSAVIGGPSDNNIVGAAWIFTRGTIASVRYPVLYLSTPSVVLGSSLTISGSSCTPNSTVQLSIVGTTVSYSQVISSTTSADGSFTYAFQSSTSTPPGDYVVQCVDDITGRSSSKIAFEITSNPSQRELTISSPSGGFEGKIGQAITVMFSDRMFRSAAYPVNGAYRSYKYAIDVSSDGGSSWNSAAAKQGSALVDLNVTMSQPITISQPGNTYAIRVTDEYQNTRKAICPSFSVTSLASSQLQVGFHWDYTFTNRAGEPTGVAADGVSRIYLSLSKKDPSAGPSISGVTLLISDGKNVGSRALGKVLIASITDRFSDEANSASNETVTDNSSRAQYWFWYVSPEDFVGVDAQDASNATRSVHATFVAKYADGSQESTARDIVIARPPLMFIHGLGAGPGTWDAFPHLSSYGSVSPLVKDNRFQVNRAVRMAPQGHFWENAASLLLAPDAIPPSNNSFASILRAMHDLGFASNQVDCISHSMGGLMVRQAETYGPSFYRQLNYSKGFVHKLVTLDTPHSGSPIADIVDGFISDFNALPISVLHPILTALKYDTWNVMTSLYDPQGSHFLPCLYQPANDYVIKPSGAVQDLRQTGGVRFPTTSIRTHLIVGDIVGGDLSLPTLSPRVEAAVSGLSDMVEFFDKVFDVLNVIGGRDQRDFLGTLSGYSKVKRIVALIDYLAKLYTGLSFFVESDVVVSVGSQLAGQARSSSNVTVVDGLNHLWVTSDLQVGNAVDNLLNASLLNSGKFAFIPSTQLTKTTKAGSRAQLASNYNMRVDDLKIALVSPTPGRTFLCDSTMTCHVAISDTVGLRYVKVYFQHESYTFTKASDIVFTVQVNASVLDTNEVTALAIYDYGDSTLFAQDVVNVVVLPGTPLVRFDVAPSVFSLATGESDRPQYRAIYGNCVSDLARTHGKIHVRISDPGVLLFDPKTNSFSGLSAGQTIAAVSYGNLNDTIYFVVTPENVTAIRESGKSVGSQVPSQYELYQNYPNPFNPSTTIRYGLPARSHVTLTVFNTLGQQVATLVQGDQETGYHEVRFDGSNVASGVYLYRIQAGDFTQTRKLLLIK